MKYMKVLPWCFKTRISVGISRGKPVRVPLGSCAGGRYVSLFSGFLWLLHSFLHFESQRKEEESSSPCGFSDSLQLRKGLCLYRLLCFYTGHAWIIQATSPQPKVLNLNSTGKYGNIHRIKRFGNGHREELSNISLVKKILGNVSRFFFFTKSLFVSF